MSRDGSGNYTLPAGNPVVSGTVIATTWANPTLSDVGQALTESLDRNGRGAMLAALRLIDGTAGIPALAFSGETSTGLYRVSAGVLGFSVLTTEVARFSAAQFSTVLGSAAVPPIAFTGDLNTGIYSPGADVLGLSVAGTEVARLSAAQFSTVLGSAAVPPIAFTGDLNTGLYSPGADQLSITTAGMQRLAISSSGNVAISAPAVNTPSLTVNSGAANFVAIALQTGAANGTSFCVAGNGTTPGTDSLDLISDTTNKGYLYQRANADLYIGTNNTTRLSIGAAGYVYVGSAAGYGATDAFQVAGNGKTFGDGIGWVVKNGANNGGGGITALTGANGGVNVSAESGPMSFGAGGSTRLNIATDGRIYGTSLHNVGTVTGTTNQYIASGTYTPTLTNTLNIAASTAAKCNWIRVGNVVTVSGTVSIDPTSASVQTQLSMSLPIASNLAVLSDLAGVGAREGALAGLSTFISAATVSDLAFFSFFNDTDVANRSWSFTFTYEVL